VGQAPPPLGLSPAGADDAMHMVTLIRRLRSECIVVSSRNASMMGKTDFPNRRFIASQLGISPQRFVGNAHSRNARLQEYRH
jgi:hypothetical protein